MPGAAADRGGKGSGPSGEGRVDRVAYGETRRAGTPGPHRTVAIVQARLGSRRFPGKVLRPILGRPMLSHVLTRVSWIRGIERILVATSKHPQDGPIVDLCRAYGYTVFRGSREDVLDRFYQAARFFRADSVIRVTADCPLLDPQLGTALLDLYRSGNYDHVAVATGAGALHLEEGRFPDGLDLECFSYRVLEEAWEEARDPGDREHVTPFIWKQPRRFRLGQLVSETDYSALRWTVDYPLDFRLVSGVYEALYDEQRPFVMEDVLALLRRCPELVENQSLAGCEGYREVWGEGPPAGGRRVGP